MKGDIALSIVEPVQIMLYSLTLLNRRIHLGATAASLYLHLYLADSILMLQSFLFSMVKYFSFLN